MVIIRFLFCLHCLVFTGFSWWFQENFHDEIYCYLYGNCNFKLFRAIQIYFYDDFDFWFQEIVSNIEAHRLGLVGETTTSCGYEVFTLFVRLC